MITLAVIAGNNPSRFSFSVASALSMCSCIYSLTVLRGFFYSLQAVLCFCTDFKVVQVLHSITGSSM